MEQLNEYLLVIDKYLIKEKELIDLQSIKSKNIVLKTRQIKQDSPYEYDFSDVFESKCN